MQKIIFCNCNCAGSFEGHVGNYDCANSNNVETALCFIDTCPRRIVTMSFAELVKIRQTHYELSPSELSRVKKPTSSRRLYKKQKQKSWKIIINISSLLPLVCSFFLVGIDARLRKFFPASRRIWMGYEALFRTIVFSFFFRILVKMHILS